MLFKMFCLDDSRRNEGFAFIVYAVDNASRVTIPVKTQNEIPVNVESARDFWNYFFWRRARFVDYQSGEARLSIFLSIRFHNSLQLNSKAR